MSQPNAMCRSRILSARACSSNVGMRSLPMRRREVRCGCMLTHHSRRESAGRPSADLISLAIPRYCTMQVRPKTATAAAVNRRPCPFARDGADDETGVHAGPRQQQCAPASSNAPVQMPAWLAWDRQVWLDGKLHCICLSLPQVLHFHVR